MAKYGRKVGGRGQAVVREIAAAEALLEQLAA
jgi:hypothetical protein